MREPIHSSAYRRCYPWSERALAVQDADSATHVIIGEKHESLHGASLPERARVVTSEWLEDCLSKQERLPEREYVADPDELAREAGSESATPLATQHPPRVQTRPSPAAELMQETALLMQPLQPGCLPCLISVHGTGSPHILTRLMGSHQDYLPCCLHDTHIWQGDSGGTHVQGNCTWASGQALCASTSGGWGTGSRSMTPSQGRPRLSYR